MKTIKKIILTITLVMSIALLLGCANKEEDYKEDQVSLQGIAEINDTIENTYLKAIQLEDVENSKVEFKELCTSGIKLAEELKVKTKEGKKYRKESIGRIEYLIDNWGVENFKGDKKLVKIDEKLEKIAEKFIEKEFGDI